MKSQCSFDCIPLNAKVVEHFFMHLLAIWISSFVKCLFRSFGVLIELFVFLEVSFLSSLYILGISPL